MHLTTQLNLRRSSSFVARHTEREQREKEKRNTAAPGPMGFMGRTRGKLAAPLFGPGSRRSFFFGGQADAAAAAAAVGGGPRGGGIAL